MSREDRPWWGVGAGRKMARIRQGWTNEEGTASARLDGLLCPPHPAILALVRLLARQAAREALFGSPIEDKDNPNDED